MNRDKIKQNIIRLLDKMTDLQLRVFYTVGYLFVKRDTPPS